MTMHSISPDLKPYMKKSVYDSDEDGIVNYGKCGGRSVTPSNTVIAEDTTEESTSNTEYTLMKEITLSFDPCVLQPVTLRIAHKLKSSSINYRAYLTIYRNGVSLGVGQDTNTDYYKTKSQDLDGWRDEDKVQTYIRIGNSNGAAYTNLLSVRGDMYTVGASDGISGEVTG